MDKCPKCGANVDPNDVFCKKCGTPLKSTQTISEQNQAETTPKPADGFTDIVEKLKAKKAAKEAKKAKKKALVQMLTAQKKRDIKLGIGIAILLWALGFVYVWLGSTGIALMPIRYSSIRWYLIIAVFWWLTSLGFSNTNIRKVWRFMTFYNLGGIFYTWIIFVYSANFTFFSGWVITTFFLLTMFFVLSFFCMFAQYDTNRDKYESDKEDDDGSDKEDDDGSDYYILYEESPEGIYFLLIVLILLSWLLCHPFTASGKEKLARRAEHFPAYQEYYQQRAAEQRAGE